jgi:hypothetical protein
VNNGFLVFRGLFGLDEEVSFFIEELNFQVGEEFAVFPEVAVNVAD